MQSPSEEGRLARASERVGRVFPPWRRWSSTQRWHAVALLALMIASVIHQLVFVYWYIEDAAISFTYAKHFADGEGFVTYPGGERVEGFSDPLWVYLMVLFEFVGISGFTSSKVMAAVFGAATLPLAYLLTEEAFGQGGRDAKDRTWSANPSPYSLLAPAWLAGSAQFAIWNASGLENSLFCLLLAGGMWRTVVETRADKWPTAALWFFGLTITRPEGILYAAFGGFWAMVLSLQLHRSPALTMKWLVTFFLPFTAYQSIRYSYFAWPFPNTYYAKLGSKEFMPFAWNARGWKYIRDWAHILWHGYLIPVYLFGLIGRKPGAKLTVLGSVAILLVLMLPGPELVKGVWPWSLFQAPPDWNETRIWTLLLVTLLLPLRALGGEGWRARVLAYGMAFIALFFALWSGGDWMKGFRWMSLLSVPLAVLFAAGSREIGPLLGAVLAPVWVPLVTALRALARRAKLTRAQVRSGLAIVGAVALVGLIAGPNLNHSAWFAKHPETGPFSVQKRVNYVNWVERRLHLTHRPTTLDVDMGANMYWSGNKIGDVAGLVDVPMGHHNYEPEFMREYVFGELNPDFVHSHGGWASRSRLQTHPEWRDRYFEIPGYPTGARGLHIGNWVRKDLFIDTLHWPEDRSGAVAFGDGIHLTGVAVPVPAAQGAHLYLEYGMKLDPLPNHATRPTDFEVRVIAFVTDGERLHSWAVPLGYDWYRPSDMKGGETFHGRFSLPLPKSLPAGTYDLGIVVMGPQGTTPELLEAGPAVVHAGVDGFAAAMATTEVRYPGLVTVLPRDEAKAAALARVDDAVAEAGAGDCETAEATWVEVQRRMTRQDSFVQAHDPRVRDALAGCYTARAEAAAEDLAVRTTALVAARDWDHRHEGYRYLARRHGEQLYQDCRLAFAEGRWEEAFTLCSDSVHVDPNRSWSRRYAELARDFKLGIDPFTKAEQEEERRQKAEERRLEREAMAEERRKRREELKGAPPPAQITPPTEAPAPPPEAAAPPADEGDAPR